MHQCLVCYKRDQWHLFTLHGTEVHTVCGIGIGDLKSDGLTSPYVGTEKFYLA